MPPCVYPATYKENPTLLCFSIVQKDGYEVDIIRAMIERKGGIFSCDGQAVLSATKPWYIGEVKTIEFEDAAVGISKDGTAGNTLLFMNAWRSLKENVDLEAYDWIVKVDPDAVLIPSRLQRHLASLTGSRHYVRNCNLYPDQPDFPMMFGSLEIFSKLAMRAYFEGEESCKRDLHWQDLTGARTTSWATAWTTSGSRPPTTSPSSATAFARAPTAWIRGRRPSTRSSRPTAGSCAGAWPRTQEARSTSAPPRRISGATPVELPKEADAPPAPPRPPPLDVAARGAGDFAAGGLALPFGA
ncbi:unnamed protein product [Prorocentrum cordatum]|uniref:Hexosyltransferase n=1 Tax=Prorocentrum cordatum TaxID=2364126 RepID=A0ABN9RRQ6_9DINO|nr:unnamed protein product [Polarella glacialis]